jgi:hypothetical protein
MRASEFARHRSGAGIVCHLWPSQPPRPPEGKVGPDSAAYQPGSGVLAGGLVLLSDAGGNAPAVADRDAAGSCPRPDTITALPAGRTSPAPAARLPPGLAGMADEGLELAAERLGVLLAQVDLVRRAVEGEPHRLIRGAAIKIVFQNDGYLLRHPGLPDHLRGKDQLPWCGNCTAPATQSIFALLLSTGCCCPADSGAFA